MSARHRVTVTRSRRCGDHVVRLGGVLLERYDDRDSAQRLASRVRDAIELDDEARAHQRERELACAMLPAIVIRRAMAAMTSEGEGAAAGAILSEYEEAHEMARDMLAELDAGLPVPVAPELAGEPERSGGDAH